MLLINWIETIIGDQVTLQRGIDITRAEQRLGNIPVISSGGISSYHDTKAVSGPGVILGRKGVVGSVYYVDCDYWPHDTTLWVKDFHGNFPRFVYYFFKNLSPVISMMDVGSANPTLNRNHVHPIYTIWPPLPEQRAIAGVLGALDDKIELNRRMNRTLESLARAIFKWWFVDLGPWGGMMPDNWHTVKFSTFLSPRVEKSNDPTIPLFSVTDTGIHPRDEKFNKSLSKADTKNKIARETDIVFGMSREILNWGIMRSRIGCVSSAYNVFAVDQSINSKYLESYIKAHSHYFNNLIRPASREGQGVDKEALMFKSIYMPPDDVLAEYYAIEDPLKGGIRENDKENSHLAALRDALLPKLMCGEVRVREIKAS